MIDFTDQVVAEIQRAGRPADGGILDVCVRRRVNA